jgi:hypothetical protein
LQTSKAIRGRNKVLLTLYSLASIHKIVLMGNSSDNHSGEQVMYPLMERRLTSSVIISIKDTVMINWEPPFKLYFVYMKQAVVISYDKR